MISLLPDSSAHLTVIYQKKSIPIRDGAPMCSFSLILNTFKGKGDPPAPFDFQARSNKVAIQSIAHDFILGNIKNVIAIINSSWLFILIFDICQKLQ